MINQYIKSPLLFTELQFIPTDKIQTFLSFLTDNGYVSTSISQYIAAVIHFSKWQRQRGRDCIQISVHDKTDFIAQHLPVCQCPRSFHQSKKGVAAALSHWIRLAGQDNGYSTQTSDHDNLMKPYDCYLKDVVGLSSATREYRCRYAKVFLTWVAENPATQLDTLTFEQLSSFVSHRANTVSRASLTVITCSLNSFLRFLSVQRRCPVSVDICVPHPKSMISLPVRKPLSEEELHRVLTEIDRSHPAGKRDYAIIRCLSDLGMRAGEVSRLNLDNIDWHNRVLTLTCPKQRNQRKLPMPDTLMAALVDYITAGRPDTKTRAVFVYHRAPLGMPVKQSTICGVVKRVFTRAGISPSHGQSHSLRHMMASRLLENEVPLKIIADVLGHQCIETTIRYTWVDRNRLQDVALPWPERKTS
jgi:site-specific recombinase XerD